jgi:hypothetical protein
VVACSIRIPKTTRPLPGRLAGVKMGRVACQGVVKVVFQQVSSSSTGRLKSLA